MICELTCDGIVIEAPEHRVARNGNEYLRIKVGLPNGKAERGTRITFLDCTIFHNPGLISLVKAYNLLPNDRVMLIGQLTVEYFKGKVYLKMFIHNIYRINGPEPDREVETDEPEINKQPLEFEMFTAEQMLDVAE